MECGIELKVPLTEAVDINGVPTIELTIQLAYFNGYRSLNNNILYHLASDSSWGSNEKETCFATSMSTIQGTTALLDEIDKETIRNAHDCNICSDSKPIAFITLGQARHNIVMLNMLKARYMNFVEFLESLMKNKWNDYSEVIEELENREHIVDIGNAKIIYWFA